MWPWNSENEKEEKIEELENRIEELEEEKEKWRNRFEAEEERRSKLSKKKQEAEERANRLEDKLEGLKSESTEKEEDAEEESERRDLSFDEARRVISKLDSINSPVGDLATVYHTGDRNDLGDLSGLKNSITGDQFREIDDSGVYLFDEDQVFDIFLDFRPFFQAEWFSGQSFELDQVSEFIEMEKVWVKASAGDTKVFREASGELEVIEHVKDRVNRQHSSGGFSQGRFEKKREEQIEGHLENVREAIPDHEHVFLVGERSLCKDLPGEYLGGFDPNRPDLEALYSTGFVTLK
ncbi:hypothetical protein GKQ38_00705 [Candidatus Nanohaloarchaea archaeon]|nr:hypothetical protein GKQ38_00705 [Candidatus Nanohaloarchaea archaeon]